MDGSFWGTFVRIQTFIPLRGFTLLTYCYKTGCVGGGGLLVQWPTPVCIRYPGLESQLCSSLQLPAGAHPGRHLMTAQVIGSLPSTGETWIEFWVLVCGLVHPSSCGHFWCEQEHERYLCLRLSLKKMQEVDKNIKFPPSFGCLRTW